MTEEAKQLLNVDAVLRKHDVFLTGASGFVGMLILYELLQVTHKEDFKLSDEVGNKIFLLLRKSSKYESVRERLEKEILKNELFDGYTKEQKDYLITKQKFVTIEGDLSLNKLGLQEKHFNQLKFASQENNGLYFIHCAADVQFDRPLNQAMELNVNGTYECAQVAHECNAKGFVHISTLYVNSREHCDARIEEKVYDQGFDGVKIFNDWRFKYDKKLSKEYIESNVNGKRRSEEDGNMVEKAWPNTYTLTKNIAEQVIISKCKEMRLPLSIARLGIVSPVGKGKQEGWFLGNGGFVFVAIGAASGHMKYFKKSSGDGRMDIVPADYTVDAVLAICSKLLNDGMFNIYNIGIAANQPNDWCVAKLFEYVVPRFKESDVPGTHPQGDVIFVKSDFWFWVIEMCIFDIPLFIIQPLKYLSYIQQLFTLTLWINILSNIWDKCLNKFGMQGSNSVIDDDDATSKGSDSKKRMTRKEEISNEIKEIENIFAGKKSKLQKKIEFMTKARQKMKWFNENYDYFMSRRWRFEHNNVKELYGLLDNESRENYDFDVNNIDINHYALTNSMFVMRKWFEKQEIRRKERKAKFTEMKNRLGDLKVELKKMKESKLEDAERDEIDIVSKPRMLSKDKSILNESCSSMRSLLNTADKRTIEAISREARHKIVTDFDESNSDLRVSKRKQIWQIMSRMGLTVGGIGFGGTFGMSLLVTIGVAWIIFR